MIKRMLARNIASAAVIATSLVAASPASAAILVYATVLSGANETPAVVTAGTGFAIITVDDVLNTMRVQVNFSGLTGNTTNAHIHCCGVQTGTVGVATTTPTFAGFPAGVTAGSYDSTLNMTLASSYNATFITNNGGTAASAFAALIAGFNAQRAYLNVHSSFAPGGEIRGTLVPVPEPATWATMLLGFGLLGAAMRWRLVSTARVSYS